MRTAAPAREAFATAIIAFKAAAIDLRLRAGDERGQAIDAAIVRRRLGLRLRRILRLRTAVLAITTMFAVATVFTIAAVLARLLLVALIGLLVVAHVGLLLLHRHEAGLLAEARIILALVLAVLACAAVVHARLLLLLRLVLAELLLGSGDQAEIVLGVLVVVL